MGRTGTALVCLTYGLLLGACTHRMDIGPPRTAPARVTPSTPAPPPSAPQSARVHFELTDGPMRVTAKPTDGSARSRELCVTPCWAELPPGHYELFLATTDLDEELSRGDSDEVTFGAGVWAYRRAPMIKREPSLVSNVFAGILGGLALNGLAFGAVIAVLDDPAPGIALTVASLGLGVFSLWSIEIDTDVEPGATTLWRLTEEGP